MVLDTSELVASGADQLRADWTHSRIYQLKRSSWSRRLDSSAQIDP
jgi:hypothetical protein